MKLSELKTIIEDYIEETKPDGVYKIIPTITNSGSKSYDLKINLQFIVEADSGLLDIEWKDKQKTRWDLTGEPVFEKYQTDLKDFISKYLGTKSFTSGRGVTEKNYWLDRKAKGLD